MQGRMARATCRSLIKLFQVDRHAEVITEDVVVNGRLWMKLAVEDHTRL